MRKRCLPAFALVVVAAMPIAAGTASAPESVPAAAPGIAPEAAAPATAPPRLVEGALRGVPPDDPRMESYSHGGYVLSALRALWAIAVLGLIVASRLGARLQAAAERVTRRPNLKVAVYVMLYTLLTFLASFPVAVYAGSAREKRFGFMNQSFAAWLGDQGKALSVEAIAQAIFFVLLYPVIRRLPRAWWIAGSALGIAFVILVLAVEPVYIAPLFNTFTPLEDAGLRGEILAMAHAQGIPADEVYEVDASRQSEHTNAYVAGLLGTQRVVLYDTLLKKFAPREIRFVMGHEMGHYVMWHIWKLIAFLSVAIIAGFWLVDRVSRRVIARRPNLAIGGLAEPASLPLMMLVLNVFLLAAAPAIATYSRALEHRADRFALRVVRDPEAGASSFVRFGRLDLGEYDVHPVIEALLYSHPSLGRRIRYAQDWARLHPETVTAGGPGADQRP